MKLRYLFFIMMLHAVTYQQCLEVNARAEKHAAIPLLLVVQSGQSDKDMLKQVADVIEHDLGFTQQFKVTQEHCVCAAPASWGYAYPIVIQMEQAGTADMKWSLFDQSQKKLLHQATVTQQNCLRAQAHAAADDIWQTLTGSLGFFSTRIAFCKEVAGKERKLKHIYLADYDGKHEQVLVDVPTINMGPRWNRDPHRPLVFYSEFTDANVRMMYTDMKKRRKVASSFDGINMSPSFSDDGKKAVFCASHGTGNAQLYYIDQNELKQLTHNTSSNFCPTLSADGQKIYFCSDYGLKQPSIFCFDLTTKKLERIANTQSSESPSYCSVHNHLAYCKAVDGVMQLFLYDVSKKEHKQLTCDRSAKHDVTWSPCGHYVLYGQDYANKSMLRMMNIISKQVYTVVQSDMRLSYPSWSPRYSHYPVV